MDILCLFVFSFVCLVLLALLLAKQIQREWTNESTTQKATIKWFKWTNE
jgi:hypothetical protein